MKLGLNLGALVFVVIVSVTPVFSQKSDAAQRAGDLRSKLADVGAKEEDLKLRLEQLDEELKPEKIEQALAGIGSTRPEELREQRRRQLQIEKDSVLNQLQHLAKNRASLESAIATADALAYHQSARGPVGIDQMVLTRVLALPRWAGGLLITLVSVIAVAGLTLIIRRRRRFNN